jgi:hypothetical protein
MSRLIVLLLGLSSLLAAPALRAQPTDTILGTTGTETTGRVLAITPSSVTYAAGPDTVVVPADSVFLIRYANGTREVLHPVLPESPPQAPDLLPGLSETQRRTLAKAAAARSYTDRGPFWTSFGATLYAGPVQLPRLLLPRARWLLTSWASPSPRCWPTRPMATLTGAKPNASSAGGPGLATAWPWPPKCC